MKNLLFVCTANLDRSPCAESLFENNKNYEAKSCGIDPLAEIVITKEALKWADTIFCMEHEHKQFILNKFKENPDKIIVLNVSNEFARNDPELEGLLRIKLRNWLK